MILVCGGLVRGQAVLTAPDTELPVPRPVDQPAAYVLPPVVEPKAEELAFDPLLNPPEAAPCGWFTNAELLFFRPHINSQLIGPVTISPTQTDVVNLQTGLLGTVVSPRLEAGYRLGDQRGEFSLAYRFEVAERNSLADDGAAQRDRLNLNIFDLDWANWHRFALAPGWDLRFNVGVRIGAIYYDTERNFGGPPVNTTGPFLERATNNVVGAGPEVGFQLYRQVLFPGLSVYGKFQGANLFCDIRQTFSEQTTSAASVVFASNASNLQVDVPMITLQAGLSYMPPGWNQNRLMLGYVWEEFWQTGRLNNPGGLSSSGDILNRGLFLRLELNF
jgi:hypothetical protein